MTTGKSPEIDLIPPAACMVEAAIELGRLRRFLQEHRNLTVERALEEYEPIRLDYERQFIERELARLTV